MRSLVRWMSAFRCLFVLCVLALPFSVAAAPLPVPGTRAQIEPPAGFTPSPRFAGFQHEELQASIMVTEIPVAAGAMKKGMTKEGLASRGVTLISTETPSIAGVEALLLHGSQTAVGTEYLKWMLVTGDDAGTIMVVATFPKSEAARVGEALRLAVLTTTFGAGSGDPFAGLSFRISPTPKLQILHRVNNLLLFSEPGKKVPLAAADPMVLVGSSISAVVIEDLAAFSEDRARKTERVQDLRGIQGRALLVGGRKAYELVADATDADEAIALRFYQVIVPDAGGYHVMQGIVGTNRADEMLPEFRRLTDSFELVEAGE